MPDDASEDDEPATLRDLLSQIDNLSSASSPKRITQAAEPFPARDGLIKKGLVYSSERGTVAFTVPHFGKFLRAQRV